MHCSISIYPQSINEETKKKMQNYLHLAKQYGFDEVFTSVHLPEFSFEDQLTCLETVSKLANQEHMKLTVDIGGWATKRLLENETYMERIFQCTIDLLRLDYGYTFEQLKILYERLNIKGFVINASTHTKQEFEDHFTFFRTLDPTMEIRTCHNFYVREESGLDQEFALYQKSLIAPYDVPITYCVPSYDAPRGPLHLGLCTIEEHRFCEVDEILLDLMHTYGAKHVLFADEWMSETQFKKIQNVLKKKEIEIPVVFEDSATEQEKQIVLGKHHFRYDSNHQFLRSESSRTMAEFADVITPNNTIDRLSGCITIDNKRYKRYSGELQVVMKDAKVDERVNVVARLAHPDDIKKLSYHRFGYDYDFIETN